LAFCERGRYFGLYERGRYSEAIFGSHAAKDRMSASPPKTAEHFPPLKKGGQGGFPMKKGGRGGFLFSTSPPSPPLPDKASPSPLPFLPLLGGFENPPRPPLVKGGDVRGLRKGEIFGVFFGLSSNPPGPLW
jgi:hypothetical protein